MVWDEPEEKDDVRSLSCTTAKGIPSGSTNMSGRKSLYKTTNIDNAGHESEQSFRLSSTPDSF